MWGIISGLAESVLGPLFGIIDKSVEDKDKANELKHNLKTQFLENMGRELQAQRDVIVAEAQGESWLQRNWRPVIMLMFGSIIANNFIVVPYASLFGIEATFLEVPVDLWELIKIGLGGYVVGRSAEKVAKVIKLKEK